MENHRCLPTSNTLGHEAFPDLGARGASPTGIKTLNEQSNSLIDPDAAITGRKQDTSFLAVKQRGKAEIDGQELVTRGRFPGSAEAAAPAVEAGNTGVPPLGQSTKTLRGNSEAMNQLGFRVKWLHASDQGQPPFGPLDGPQTILGN